MPTIRRQETREIFGQSLSDVSVSAFENQLHCDVVIVSAEGQKLRAHQVVLAKSPTLNAALKLSEVRRLPEAIVMLPDFNKGSLILLLQFLYTGEVELVTASELLVEFQDLCKVLDLNPAVKKSRFPPKPTEPDAKFSCEDCKANFDKSFKVVFHKQCCSNKMKESSSSVCSKVPAAALNPPNCGSHQNKPIAATESIRIEDHFFAESSDVIGQEEICGGGGTGFQMPDNFDLPDEIIQEQIPAAPYTSTPIRYAEPPKKMAAGVSPTKKVEPKEVHNEKTLSVKPPRDLGGGTKRKAEKKSFKEEPSSSSQGISVAEELAAKRKRIMVKLRVDEEVKLDDRHEKRDKKGKRAQFMQANRVKLDRKKHHVRGGPSASGCKDWIVDDDVSSEEEDRWKPSHSEDTDNEEDAVPTTSDDDECVQPKSSKNRRSDQRAGNALTKKLKVSTQLNGKERIIELAHYKLQLLRTNESDEEEKEKKPPLRLEKIGKRIKRLVSDGSSSSEDSFDELTKKKLSKVDAAQSNYAKSGVKQEEKPKAVPIAQPSPAKDSITRFYENLNMPPPVAPIKIVGPKPESSASHLSLQPMPQRNTLSGLSFKKKKPIETSEPKSTETKSDEKPAASSVVSSEKPN